MSLSQASSRKSPAGDAPTESLESGTKRMVPSSKSLLEKIDKQLAAPQKTKDSLEQTKRQLLQLCGCL